VILRPFSKFMLKAIEKIRPLEINAICTGHGPILRSTWKDAVDKSEQLAKKFLETTEHCQQNVLITYVSAYGYTKEMAHLIAEGVRQAGTFDVRVIDIETMLLGDLEEHLTQSNAIIIGSPTINQNTLLPIYRLFAVINPLRDRGKLATAFGSYGWSGEAVKIIEANIKALKLNMIQEALAKKFSPNNEKIAEYIEFGKKFGEQLLQSKNIQNQE